MPGWCCSSDHRCHSRQELGAGRKQLLMKLLNNYLHGNFKSLKGKLRCECSQCIQVGHTSPGVTLWYNSRLVPPTVEASERKCAQPDHLLSSFERFSVLNSSTPCTKRQDAADDEGQHSLHGREGAGKGTFITIVVVLLMFQSKWSKPVSGCYSCHQQQAGPVPSPNSVHICASSPPMSCFSLVST